METHELYITMSRIIFTTEFALLRLPYPGMHSRIAAVSAKEVRRCWRSTQASAAAQRKNDGKSIDTVAWLCYIILVLTKIAKMPDWTESISVKELMFKVELPAEELLTMARHPVNPSALELRKKHKEVIDFAWWLEKEQVWL